ncbi:MAG: tetratricopeptide repeat protein, partial [Symploca sp. SIO1C4]|nr:tetratricopeptide repeat protein [Symploca sp. SIO1C4]
MSQSPNLEAQLYFALGLRSSEAEEYERAIANFEKATQLKPDYFQAYYHQGIVLGYLGRIEEAIASYSKATQLKPDYLEAWYN